MLALQLRTPMVVAMAGATLQALHPDRDVLLGVGISSPVVTSQWHGVPYGDRPLARVREYVTLLRECLSGETRELQRRLLPGAAGSGWGSAWASAGPRSWWARSTRRMLRLAGEVADGVLLNYLPASHVAVVGRAGAGRRRSGAPTGAPPSTPTSTSGCASATDGIDLARRDLFSLRRGRRLRRATSSGPASADEVAEVRARHAAGDRDAALAAVSDRMVDAIDIMGDADHVRATRADYVDAGVDVPVRHAAARGVPIAGRSRSMRPPLAAGPT